MGRRAYRESAIRAGAQPIPCIPKSRRTGYLWESSARGAIIRPKRARLGRVWTVFTKKKIGRSKILFLKDQTLQTAYPFCTLRTHIISLNTPH
jgi:hypothetical protein